MFPVEYEVLRDDSPKVVTPDCIPSASWILLGSLPLSVYIHLHRSIHVPRIPPSTSYSPIWVRPFHNNDPWSPRSFPLSIGHRSKFVFISIYPTMPCRVDMRFSSVSAVNRIHDRPTAPVNTPELSTFNTHLSLSVTFLNQHPFILSIDTTSIFTLHN